jgi:hypothetical protein
MVRWCGDEALRNFVLVMILDKKCGTGLSTAVPNFDKFMVLSSFARTSCFFSFSLVLLLLVYEHSVTILSLGNEPSGQMFGMVGTHGGTNTERGRPSIRIMDYGTIASVQARNEHATIQVCVTVFITEWTTIIHKCNGNL